MTTERQRPISGGWPPEVPPFRPPVPPSEPPGTPRPDPPQPILPTWEEYEPSLRERDLVDRLLEQRIITVTGHLDDELANRVASQLLILGKSRRPIELHLASSASDLGASLSLADAIDMVKAPVHARVRGALRGPAVAVLCACDKRAAHRNALFVLSVPSTAAEGTSAELGARAEEYERQLAQLRDRVTLATGRDAGEVSHDFETGRLLSAEEAREYGLVDELL